MEQLDEVPENDPGALLAVAQRLQAVVRHVEAPQRVQPPPFLIRGKGLLVGTYPPRGVSRYAIVA